MKALDTWIIWEIIIILLVVIIYFLYKLYKRHKDKNKVKTVLDYLQYKTGNIEVEKLQKILGVNKNESKSKNKQK